MRWPCFPSTQSSCAGGSGSSRKRCCRGCCRHRALGLFQLRYADDGRLWGHHGDLARSALAGNALRRSSASFIRPLPGAAAFAAARERSSSDGPLSATGSPWTSLVVLQRPGPNLVDIDLHQIAWAFGALYCVTRMRHASLNAFAPTQHSELEEAPRSVLSSGKSQRRNE